MRKKIGIWIACGAMAATLAACGSDESDDTTSAQAPASIAEIDIDPGPFDSEEDFGTAVTSYCDQRAEIKNRVPILGNYATGLEAEFAARLEFDQQDIAKLEEFQPPESLSADWDALIAATQADLDFDEEVVAVSADGDTDAAYELLSSKRASAAFDGIDEAQVALGEDFCGTDGPSDEGEIQDSAVAEATGETPSEFEPTGTVEDAVDAYIAGQGSKDCADVVANSHSQNYLEEADLTCPVGAEFAEAAEVVETAQWGPIGAAVIAQEDSVPVYQEFIFDEATGDFGTTSNVYVIDGGLQPANEGIDADQVAADIVEAIRADDPEAFNATLTIDEAAEGQAFTQTGSSIDEIGNDPVYGKRIIEDIRESDAEPELIVANQARAYYLLETEATTYVLVLTHEPGTPTGYRFTGYWALTE